MMPEVLFAYLTTPNFATTIWLASIIYLLPLARRPRFWLRLLVGSAAFLAGGLVIRLYMTLLHQLAAYLLQIALCMLLIWLCCRVSWQDALFAATCGFATQFFATSLASLLVPGQMMPDYGAAGGMACFPQATPVTIGVHGAVYLAAYFLLARRMVSGGKYGVQSFRPVFSALVLLLFGSLLNGQTYGLYYGDAASGAYRTCLLYGLLCSALYLVMQSNTQHEIQLGTRIEVERRLRDRQRQQYEQSRKNIELINKKCHALKIRLAELSRASSDPESRRNIQALEDTVMIYDAAMHTGNPVLDTVLTEKSLQCEQKGIQWTCMADGARLEFLDSVDLYTLFGMTLDRAIAQVEQLPEPARRVIGVTASVRGGAAFLQFENYFAGRQPQPLPPELEPIVKKYGGELQTEAQDGICLTRILLPLPAAE